MPDSVWKIAAALGAVGGIGSLALALRNRRDIERHERDDERTTTSVENLRKELDALKSWATATDRVLNRWAGERATQEGDDEDA